MTKTKKPFAKAAMTDKKKPVKKPVAKKAPIKKPIAKKKAPKAPKHPDLTPSEIKRAHGDDLRASPLTALVMSSSVRTRLKKFTTVGALLAVGIAYVQATCKLTDTETKLLEREVIMRGLKFAASEPEMFVEHPAKVGHASSEQCCNLSDLPRLAKAIGVTREDEIKGVFVAPALGEGEGEDGVVEGSSPNKVPDAPKPGAIERAISKPRKPRAPKVEPAPETATMLVKNHAEKPREVVAATWKAGDGGGGAVVLNDPGTPVFPRTGTVCAVCHQPQFTGMGGMTCANGHGGAPALYGMDGKMVVAPFEGALSAPVAGSAEWNGVNAVYATGITDPSTTPSSPSPSPNAGVIDGVILDEEPRDPYIEGQDGDVAPFEQDEPQPGSEELPPPGPGFVPPAASMVIENPIMALEVFFQSEGARIVMPGLKPVENAIEIMRVYLGMAARHPQVGACLRVGKYLSGADDGTLEMGDDEIAVAKWLSEGGF